MAESGENRVCCGEKEDRLSKLPTQLREEILGYLPFLDAIRTSVLSSEWRYIWTGVSKLVFDRSFWLTLRTGNQLEIMNRVLLAHDGPVSECYLYLDDQSSNESAVSWLRILSKKGIEKVEIIGWRVHVPHLIFEFHKLKKLRLCHCILEPPQELTGFPYLISLNLYDVYMDWLILGDLVRLCPLLEDLIIEHEYLMPKIRHVVLNSYSLKTLQLKNLDLGTLSLKNVPNLTRVTLRGRSGYESSVRLVGAMSSLCEVKELSFHFSLLKDIWMPLNVRCPSCLPTPFEKLNNMSLVGMDIYSSEDILFALWLIRSSPNLRCLSLYLDRRSRCRAHSKMSEILLESQTREGSILSNVSTVWIHEVTRCMQFIMLVKVILLRCPNLKTLFIVPRYKDKKALELLKSELVGYHLYSDKVQFHLN